VSEVIYSKAKVSLLIQNAVDKAGTGDIPLLAAELNKEVLTKKIKFPVLEHCAKELYGILDNEKHIEFLDNLVQNKEMGSWVIAGKLLQYRLDKNFEESLNKAIEYIIAGNEWYVCDIVGERVFGHALLTYPDKMLPKLKVFVKHEDKWIVRSVGIAAHYATKKGLQMPYVEDVFKLLLSQANTTEFHTKKGIGWGAKTIAKFHPDLMKIYENEIFNSNAVKRWFITKVNIGLNRKKNKIDKSP
jgi:3-methyladenine DNA glycosylase AlkD